MMNRLKNKLKDNDLKTVIKSFASLSVLQIFNLILPLFALPYIARVIGVENFGLLAFSAAIIVFFQTTIDYGFNYTAVRDMARIRDDKEKTSYILSVVINTKIFLLLVSSTVLLILCLFVPLFKDNLLIIVLSFLIVPSSVFYQEWFFQSIEKMHLIALLSMLSKIFYLVTIFLFINQPKDFLLIPVFNAISVLIVGVFSLYIVLFKYGYKIYIVSFKDIRDNLKLGFNMFVSLIAPNLYTNISMIWLTQFWGKSPTAYFDSGYKVIGLSQIVTSVFSRAFFPLLSRKMDYHNFYKKINFIIALFSSLVLFFGADIFVDILFGRDYIEAVNVIKVMSITPFFISLMNVYGTNYLVLKGKENILRNIIIFCSFFGLFLTFILVYYKGYIGAAYSIAIVWGVRGFLTMYFAKKMERN